MKAVLWTQHQTRCKMAGFMRVESAPIVEQSLDGIIRYGRDSLHWKQNYNLLHYVAECVDGPSDILGALSGPSR